MRRCRAALVAAVLVAPPSAAAQVETHSKLSVSAAEIYDGNLFATPSSAGPQADLISRFGPALEAGLTSHPLELVARYEIQAERYLNHADLNDNAAHQDALLTVRYLPTRRLRMTIDASYIRTQTPGELNLVSQLGVGRRLAERSVVTAIAAYNWTDVVKVSVTQSFAKDALVGGAASETHDSRVGIERRTGPQSAYHLDYQFRTFDFDGGAPSSSHAITAGRVYSFAPRTGLEIAAGPRFTQGTVRPEVLTTLRYQLERGELSVGYSRTEVTAIGEQGAIEVHRIAATASYRLGRRLRLTTTPAFTRSARGFRPVPVYSLDVGSEVAMTRQLSLLASGRIGRQYGMLTGQRDMIPSRSLILKVMMTLPASAPRQAGRAAS